MTDKQIMLIKVGLLTGIWLRVMWDTYKIVKQLTNGKQ